MPKGSKKVQFNFTIKQHYLQLKGLGYYMYNIKGIRKQKPETTIQR